MSFVLPLLRDKRKSLGQPNSVENDPSETSSLIAHDASRVSFCSSAGRNVLGFGYCRKQIFRGLMQRREFITLLGGAAVGWPIAAHAQKQTRTYRLGVLIPSDREMPAVVAFFDELRLAGFIEGENLTVIPSGFGIRNEQIAELAPAIVKATPDAIVCGPELPIRALQAATRTIPLIGMAEDLVGSGLANSLARPGGNTTGISLLSPELDEKRQDILIEAAPGARRMAMLVDSNTSRPRHLQALQAAGRRRGVELSVFGVSRPEEIAPAINDAKASGAEALNFLATPLFSLPGSTNSHAVLEAVLAARLPAIYQWPETAEDGGLAAYGPRFTQVYRQRARQVAKVLRGAKPADLPIEQPTNFELVINLRSAKAIGHEVPAGLVLRADHVIE
jgi:putative tryptophan/tyrosine transport system substrate-binding protein